MPKVKSYKIKFRKTCIPTVISIPDTSNVLYAKVYNNFNEELKYVGDKLHVAENFEGTIKVLMSRYTGEDILIDNLGAIEKIKQQVESDSGLINIRFINDIIRDKSYKSRRLV